MGFLDDESGLIGGLAQGLQGAIKGYWDAEDRQYKRLDYEAKKLSAKKEAEAKEYERQLNTFKSGAKEKRDESGGLIGFERDESLVDPTEKAFKESQTVKNLAEASRKEGGGDPLAQELKRVRLAEAQAKIDAAKFKQTPAGRVQALNSSDKQRLDNVTLALKSTQDMAQALQAGDDTFSIVGDNNFTQAKALFKEALGRMQSGGAIQKDEAADFMKMAPTFADKPAMRLKKLQDLQREMKKRLGTLGISHTEIPDFQYKDITSLDPEQNAGMLPEQGMIQPKPKGTPAPVNAAAQKQIADAEAWLKDPKNAKSADRQVVEQGLKMLRGQ